MAYSQSFEIALELSGKKQMGKAHCLILSAFCLIFQTTFFTYWTYFLAVFALIQTFWLVNEVLLAKFYQFRHKFTKRKSPFGTILETIFE